jgi:4-amino-4-deoxy-L-arabinose transferase-like glycosyltransferase
MQAAHSCAIAETNAAAVLNTAELARKSSLFAGVQQRLRGAQIASVADGRLIAAALFVFAVVWLAVLAATSLAAPVDNIEQLVWLRSLEWGYYKHPPLPTFVAWIAVHLLGTSAWTTYLLGALTTLGAMAVFWRLLRTLRGARYAAIGLLAALSITFYNDRLYYYNHNILLLLLATAAAALCWRAYDERRLRWWVGVGVVLGLGALTKYQVAITVVSVACFWISQRGWRDPVHRRGALLATLVALAVFTPHLLWLPHHDFGPITYAMESSLGAHLAAGARTLDTLNWLVDELGNRAFPALLLLGLAMRSSPSRPALQALASRAPDERRLRAGRALLVCWGVVPLVFMPLASLLFGVDLQMQWGTSFLLFVVPCLMELWPLARWNSVPQARVWKVFVVLQLVLLGINIATSPFGVGALKDTHWRTFSAAQLADRLAAPAREQLGGPIAVVIGSVGEAGALALELPEAPLVLVDGRHDRSPWVSRELVAACGALELAHGTHAPAGMEPVGAPFAKLYWRVVPPQVGAGPCGPPAASGR